MTGSAAITGSPSGSRQLVHCDQPLGTAALVAPPAAAISALDSGGLKSPVPLIRLMMVGSGCFQVVDRGGARGTPSKDRQPAGSGTPPAQYLVRPNIVFSRQSAGGRGLIGTSGSPEKPAPRIEAQAALFLTDAQTGVQTALAEGLADPADFGGGAGLLGFDGGIAGLGAIPGYGDTAEGKLVAAAFLDAYNKLVPQVPATTANLPSAAPRATPQREEKALLRDLQRELKTRGYYTARVDGIYGKRTEAAISGYQRDAGLPVDGRPTEDLLAHILASPPRPKPRSEARPKRLQHSSPDRRDARSGAHPPHRPARH